MRLAVIGLASSHVDQIVRLAAAGRLGPGRIGALWAPPVEPVPPDRVDALHRRAGWDRGTADPARGQGASDPVRVALDHGCDAAIVSTRDPRSHRALAEPLLAAGLPVFVDKPFVADPVDAEVLVAVAERAGALLTSSSALRWHPTVLAAALRWASASDAGASRPTSAGPVGAGPAKAGPPGVGATTAEPAGAGPADSTNPRPGGGVTVRVSGPADPDSPDGGRAFLGVHAVEAAVAALAPRAAVRATAQSGSDGSDGPDGPDGPATGSPRVVRVTDHGDRRVAEVAVGPDRAVIELGPFDGWRIAGPGVDATLPLDDEYLRPGLLGFVQAVGGRTAWPLTGAHLVATARVVAQVCG